MSIKSALLAGTAAMALTSPAFAGTGDAYVSLFGGWSSLAESGFDHYRHDTFSYTKTGYFIPLQTVSDSRTFVVRSNYVNSKVGTTYKTFSAVYGRSFGGRLTRLQYYDYSRSFSGDVGEEGWVIGAALGVDLMQGLRVEVEAAFRRYDLESSGALNDASFYRTYLRRNAIYNYHFPIVLGSNTTFKYTSFVNPTTKTTNLVSSYNVKNYWTKVATSNQPVVVDGELSSFSFMFNIWYDLPLGDSGLVPFIGGGIGVANLTLDYRMRTPGSVVFPNSKYDEFHKNFGGGYTTTATSGNKVATYTIKASTFSFSRPFSTDLKEDEAVFAYQFGAGLGYEFRNGVRLTAQYRYFATGEADFGYANNVNVESSDVLVGVTLPLGRQRVRD